MPSVTRNEGIFSRVTNKPLTRPMRTAVTIAITKATPSEATPALKSVHISTGEKPKTEPTERSNSPAVMRRVMASAMKPISTVKISVLLMFRGERKSGLIDQKTRSSTTRSTNGPSSGLAMRRRTSGLRSTSDSRSLSCVAPGRAEGGASGASHGAQNAPAWAYLADRIFL